MSIKKVWGVRKPNTSRILKGDYVYLGEYGRWVIEETRAITYKLKREARAIAESLGGELYERR